MDIDDLDPESIELLENCCSFAVGAGPSPMLDESDELIPIAGDGSGGVFYEWLGQETGEGAPVVYLSSYGEASRFAANVREALALIVACPTYWGDLLALAHAGAGRVRSGIAHYETDLDEGANEYVPSEVRIRLRELLDLPVLDVPARLAAAVRAKPEFRPTLDNLDGTHSQAASFAKRLEGRRLEDDE